MSVEEPKVNRERLLVVDDEAVVCSSCERLLSEEGYQVETSQDPKEGLAMVERTPYDVILVDLRMPGINGLEFLRRAKQLHPDTEVVIITGFAEIATAVEAIKAGAFDYIPKPFSPDQLIVAVKKVFETRTLVSENRYLRRELQSQYGLDNIVGNHPAMQEVYELITRLAATTTTALIRGESGTGKELIARAIHYHSDRKNARFVPVDCGALHENLLESELFGHVKGAFTGAISGKPGLFAIADGGTLFLDEIGNTSLLLQTKLLRVLQERVFTPVGCTRERKTDLRLIVATNKDLEAMVAEGSFRQELFYRLNIVPIDVPPMRSRKEDIPALAMHFLRKLSKENASDVRSISSEALSILIDYDWPGNVRELQNVIHRAVVLAPGTIIDAEQLPVGISERIERFAVHVPRTSDELKSIKKELRERSVETVERRFVFDALKRSDWNVTHAANNVGMQRSNFQALMRKHDIHVPDNLHRSS